MPDTNRGTGIWGADPRSVATDWSYSGMGKPFFRGIGLPPAIGQNTSRGIVPLINRKTRRGGDHADTGTFGGSGRSAQ
jgi:hypothetical protein